MSISSPYDGPSTALIQGWMRDSGVKLDAVQYTQLYKVLVTAHATGFGLGRDYADNNPRQPESMGR